MTLHLQPVEVHDEPRNECRSAPTRILGVGVPDVLLPRLNPRQPRTRPTGFKPSAALAVVVMWLAVKCWSGAGTAKMRR